MRQNKNYLFHKSWNKEEFHGTNEGERDNSKLGIQTFCKQESLLILVLLYILECCVMVAQ